MYSVLCGTLTCAGPWADRPECISSDIGFSLSVVIGTFDVVSASFSVELSNKLVLLVLFLGTQYDTAPAEFAAKKVTMSLRTNKLNYNTDMFIIHINMVSRKIQQH